MPDPRHRPLTTTPRSCDERFDQLRQQMAETQAELAASATAIAPPESLAGSLLTKGLHIYGYVQVQYGQSDLSGGLSFSRGVLHQSEHVRDP